MIYVKSAIAGLLAIVAASFALLVLGILGMILYAAIHQPPDGSVGWDPISLTKRPPFLVLAFFILCFAGGFFWEFRRLTHR